MTGQLLLLNALILFVYMTIWFGVAMHRRRLDTVDTAWGLGFVVLAWSSVLQQPSTRSLVVAVIVTIWGLRLANHIWQRSKTHKEDPRYVELSSKWRGNIWLRAYWSIFMLQAILILVVGLPIVMATNQQLDGLGWLTIVGGSVWLVGFIFETVSDRQLRNFLLVDNHTKVLQTGLWRYSRHPNYFGELVQWSGISIIALQTSYGWLGLVGPAVLSWLIIKISGIPPIEKRRVKDAEYRKYRKRTSPLIPRPPHR